MAQENISPEFHAPDFLAARERIDIVIEAAQAHPELRDPRYTRRVPVLQALPQVYGDDPRVSNGLRGKLIHLFDLPGTKSYADFTSTERTALWKTLDTATDTYHTLEPSLPTDVLAIDDIFAQAALAKEIIHRSNAKLVPYWARKLCHDQEYLSEMMLAADAGLVKAIDRYILDEEKNSQATFAYFAIRWMRSEAAHLNTRIERQAEGISWESLDENNFYYGYAFSDPDIAATLAENDSILSLLHGLNTKQRIVVCMRLGLSPIALEDEHLREIGVDPHGATGQAILQELNGMTFAEINELTGLSYGLYANGVKKMRHLLDNRGDL